MSVRRLHALAGRALVAACVFVTTACVPPHVKIELPARDAPMPERVAAYRTYRPKSLWTVSGDGGESETLRLANDEYVTHVEDLLPAVEPESHTAAHAQRALDYQTPSDLLSATTSLTAIGYIVSIFAYGFTSASTYAEPLPLTLLGVSLTSWLVNGLAISPVVSEERNKAFESYDEDLLQRLRMQRKAHLEDHAAPP